MTSVIAATDGELGSRGNHRIRHFLEQQLPLVTQRLQLALDKLQSPTQQLSEMVPLQTWWEQTKARNHGSSVDFVARVTSEPMIPRDLFDSVVENLLENARQKRQLHPDIEISVTLEANEQDLRLEVHDSGASMPGTVAQNLFRRPVTSPNGLGIGLYQAARQAEVHGYELYTDSNVDGHVCIAMVRRPARALN
jgi:signal transduction histidine kinase